VTLENTPRPLSREFLLKRGWCCNYGCQNCPYQENKVKTTVTQRTEMSIDDFNKIILTDASRINRYLEGENPKIEYKVSGSTGDYGGYSYYKVTKVVITVEKKV